MRERIANVLIWLGAIALFIAVMPSFQYTGGVTPDKKVADYMLAHPGIMPFHEVYHFGWSESPLVHYVNSQSLVTSPDGGITIDKSAKLTIGWLSRSSFSLVLAIVLFCAAKVLRRLPTEENSRPKC